MADEEEPEAEKPSGASEDDDAESDGRHLFGIDLGRRGDRDEQKSRDAVEAAPVKKVKAVIRTLTERLASAASDRDDAASRKRQEKRHQKPKPENGEN
jgi:hypothetical protein